MTYSVWSGFDNIRNIIQKSSDPAAVARADAALDAIMETIADILPTAAHETLEKGAMDARELLHDTVRKAGADDNSVSYLAGRVSAIVDVLGHASRQTVDETMVEIARRRPYADILVALSEKPMRNVDLVARLGSEKARISRLLELLRSIGTVTSHKNGREVVNALTPLGRSLVEQGIQDKQRVALDQSAVHDLPEATEYNLNRLRSTAPVRDDRFPLLSAATA